MTTTPATDPQIELLKQLGVSPEKIATLDKTTARSLIGDLRNRPTDKQIMCLMRNGMSEADAKVLTAAEARVRIGEIADKQGWHKQ